MNARTVARSLALGFAFLAVLVLATEGVSRFVYGRIEERYVDYGFANFLDAGPRIFRHKRIDGEKVLYSRYFPTRYYSDRKDTRGKYISADKEDGTFRVFAFGGSITAGSPFGHWGSFARFVEDELERIRKEGTRIEVMNFGVSGYGSSRVAKLLQRTLEYEPDLLILYTGHNDLNDACEIRGGMRERELNAEPSAVDSVARTAFRHLHAFRLAHFLTRPQAPPPENPFTAIEACAGWSKLTPDQHRYMDSFYRQNLSTIIDAAGERGVPVVLLSQLSNHLARPRKSPETDPTGPLERRLAKEWIGGRLDALEQSADELLASGDNDAIAHYYQGLASLGAGRVGEAKELLARAIQEDAWPKRFRSSQRAILEEMHDPANGVYYVDALAHAEKLLGDGIIDGRLVIDRYHTNITGNRLIAGAILRDYFVAHRVRDDLLRYDGYDPASVWEMEIENEWYGRVCSRFGLSKDWRECNDKLLADFERSDRVDAKRLDSRVWEFLYYYGLAFGDEESLRVSRSIFSPSPLAARAARDAADDQT